MFPPFPEAFDSSGCFETCRVSRGKVLRLQEHLKRLLDSARTLGVSFSPSQARLALAGKAREVGEGFVRIAVRRWGEPKILLHSHRGLPYSKAQRARGVSVMTVAQRQSATEAVPAQVKHSERLGSVMAQAEGRAAAEVLRLGPQGYLTEGLVSNLFLVKGGKLITPPLWLGVLEGVTRGRILEEATRLKVPVAELPVTRHDLFNAEEAFLTNVLMEVLPIRQVDGRSIGTHVPGRITRRLLQKLKRSGHRR